MASRLAIWSESRAGYGDSFIPGSNHDFTIKEKLAASHKDAPRPLAKRGRSVQSGIVSMT